MPEMWHTNIGDWTKIYDVRLKTWLRAIEKAEESIETKPRGFTFVYIHAGELGDWPILA